MVSLLDTFFYFRYIFAKNYWFMEEEKLEIMGLFLSNYKLSTSFDSTFSEPVSIIYSIPFCLTYFFK